MDYYEVSDVSHLKTRCGGKVAGLMALKKFARVPRFHVLIDHAEVGAAPWKSSSLAPGRLWAVRSSANLEDGSGHAFAGLFESVLSVASNDVPRAIEQVLKSTNASRVRDYCRDFGVDVSTLEMNVIVQEMVPADVSGVAISARDESFQSMVVEAVFGLGELLVGGGVTPTRWLIDRGSRATAVSSGYQEWKLCCSEGGVVEERLPTTDWRARPLNPLELDDISELAFAAERALGVASVDLEWAVAGGQLYALQARPFTPVRSA